jgi:hypothetical protein
MFRTFIGSLLGFAAVAAWSAPAYAEDNPIFGRAVVKIHTPKQNKAVTGKGFYADLYGYYGNYYNNIAGAYGNNGMYYKSYSDYYSAYLYSGYATTDYYYAYVYQLNGQ